MPSWMWVLIAIAVVVVLGVIVWQALARRRTGRLQQQFGPEYKRTLDKTDSRRDAEAELQAREERRQQLEIQPLSHAARDRYLQSWQSVQAQFVDHPQVVENYRHGHRLAQASADGGDSTEDLRQAMRHYRALFDELVEPPADQPATREQRKQQEDINNQPRERTVR